VKVIVVGSGRLGANVASTLDQEGHTVVVVDKNPTAFRRLDPRFGGTTLAGDGTDIDVLKKAGIGEADVFLALTNSNNANIMMAQVAMTLFGVRRVVAEALDPDRVRVFEVLGIPYVNPFALGIAAVLDKVREGV
jgi:trk system potassium uptake protein TrkA